MSVGRPEVFSQTNRQGRLFARWSVVALTLVAFTKKEAELRIASPIGAPHG